MSDTIEYCNGCGAPYRYCECSWPAQMRSICIKCGAWHTECKCGFLTPIKTKMTQINVIELLRHATTTIDSLSFVIGLHSKRQNYSVTFSLAVTTGKPAYGMFLFGTVLMGKKFNSSIMISEFTDERIAKFEISNWVKETIDELESLLISGEFDD